MFLDLGFIELGKDIYLYNKFASEQECKDIVTIIDSMKKEDFYWPDDQTCITGKMLEVDIIKQRLVNILDNKLKLGENSGVVVMKQGSFLGTHSDNHDFENSSKSIVYGMVVYFNEFDGGEIYYPAQNIEYKPQPGDLIIHSAKSHCLHGVKEVKNNSRYCHSNHIYEVEGL
jgi:Rps23 Pro-64 3,4-dihydroxylase Tpa1-like proline 4-hydroxylase